MSVVEEINTIYRLQLVRGSKARRSADQEERIQFQFYFIVSLKTVGFSFDSAGSLSVTKQIIPVTHTHAHRRTNTKFELSRADIILTKQDKRSGNK